MIRDPTQNDPQLSILQYHTFVVDLKECFQTLFCTLLALGRMQSRLGNILHCCITKGSHCCHCISSLPKNPMTWELQTEGSSSTAFPNQRQLTYPAADRWPVCHRVLPIDLCQGTCNCSQGLNTCCLLNKATPTPFHESVYIS